MEKNKEILEKHAGGKMFTLIEKDKCLLAMEEVTNLLIKENEELKTWKSEAILVNSKWDKLRELLQNHPSVKVGDDYSHLAIQLIQSLQKDIELQKSAIEKLNALYRINKLQQAVTSTQLKKANERIKELELNLSTYNKCDACGCQPNVILRTSKGSFCQTHVIY